MTPRHSNALPEPGSGTLRRRLIWLISGRVVVSTVLLGAAVLVQIRAPEAQPADPFFLLIAFTFALTVLYAATLSFAERHRLLIFLQLCGDTAMTTVFLYLTGGINSYFSFLYMLPIIGGSMLLLRDGGIGIALLSTVLYGALVLGQYASVSDWLAGGLGIATTALPPVRVAEYLVAANVFAFFAVALLSGSLAERALAADRRLAQASTAIADLKAINQHIIDSLTSGLVTTDPAGRLLTFNRAAELITGRAAATVIGQPAARVLQIPPEFASLLAADLPDSDSRRADYTFRTEDGTARELGLSAAHLVTPDGRAGFLLTFQDVTEIRRLERDGRRKQRLAALGEMAAGIAHEIRNPLASLRGSIQVLRQELTLNDEQAQLMDIVLRESERLNDTIRSFLAYARPQRPATTRFDLARTLRETAVLIRNSPDVRNDHHIEVVVDPEELWFDADENQIRQIVWNLATNGVRAMPDGGRLRLVARFDPATAPPTHVLLRVEDQGVGIDTDDLDGIFQPFHGRFAKGSGLGLAIVHRIVTDHDGEIAVESEKGRGTAIGVRLPLQQGVPERVAASSKLQAARGSQTATQESRTEARGSNGR
jgi:two-component system sensor histidine kinase PilS (NtrC family)